MDLKNNYITIQGWMVQDLKLSGNALITYALIFGFCQDSESEFKGSIGYMCSWLNVSRPTVSKALQELIDRNLIVKTEFFVSKVQFNTYKISLPPVKNLYGGSKESLQGGSKESLQGGSKESLHNKDILDKDRLDKDNDKYIFDSQKLKKFNFEKKLLEFGFEKELVRDWLIVRKNKKATNSETAFNSFVNEITRKPCNINEMLKVSVENSWSGFKHSWVENLIKNNGNTNNSKTIANGGLQGANGRRVYVLGDEEAANDSPKQPTGVELVTIIV